MFNLINIRNTYNDALLRQNCQNKLNDKSDG